MILASIRQGFIPGFFTKSTLCDITNNSSSILVNTELGFKKVGLIFTLSVDGEHQNKTLHTKKSHRGQTLMPLKQFVPKTYLFGLLIDAKMV